MAEIRLEICYLLCPRPSWQWSWKAGEGVVSITELQLKICDLLSTYVQGAGRDSQQDLPQALKDRDWEIQVGGWEILVKDCLGWVSR